MDEKPIRGEAVRLTAPQRNDLLKTLKIKALDDDMQSILALGMFELTEATKKLNDSLTRSGVAV